MQKSAILQRAFFPVLYISTGLFVIVASGHVRVDNAVVLSLEAEAATQITPPMIVKEDAAASGLRALQIPAGTGRGWLGEAGGDAILSVDISNEAEYHFWLRTYWAGGCGNAVYLSVDDGRQFVVGNDALFSQWHWVKTGPINLTPGSHSIQLSNHSDGVMIDKIEIANDALYKPRGYGSPISYFYDGFGGCDGQNFGSWEPLAGSWTVIDDSFENTMGLSSTLAHIGSDAGLVIAPQITWDAFHASVRVMSAGTGPIGIMFRIDDVTSYVVKWESRTERESSAVSLVRVVDGAQDQQLAVGGQGYDRDVWYELGLLRNGGRLDVLIDSKLIASGEAGSESSGVFGLYADSGIATYFDNVTIRSLNAHTADQ